MTIAKIHGAEFPVKAIFSNKFNFRIPLYQRPYSWTIEEAGELVDDLISFIGSDDSKSASELSPYFLGSIVLIKEEGVPDGEVVDGQQRLTTLTILLSALRHTIQNPDMASTFTGYLYEKGNLLEENPNRYRLTLRERDADFFRSYIQEEDGIERLRELDEKQLTDSRKNIRANAVLFLELLEKLSDIQRVNLGRFIVQNCLLVVVSTPDLNSAYRIFSILNDRGMDLSHTDILKSEIVGRLPSNQQEAYSEKWEDTEEELGREAFSELFGHIRMIFRKQKSRETLLREFREHIVNKIKDSKKLIDDLLIPFADSYLIIESTSYESSSGAERVNQILKWLNRIDNFDWIPPSLLFLAENKANSDLLYHFFRDLEKLAAFMMICRYGINERIERYGNILNAIEKKEDLFADDSPLQLSAEESLLFVKELNGDVYQLVPKRRMYILLRLDSALSDGSAIYDHAVVSIEHVLPQNPEKGSKWNEWFPTQNQRDFYVHRLGNLLLLNRKKNSSARNFDFDRKKNSYFTKGGVSPFPLTSQAISEIEWTPEVIVRRQKLLLESLKNVWRLEVDIEDEFPQVNENEIEKEKRANYHAKMIPRLESHFKEKLEHSSGVLWCSEDNSIVISCQASKKYDRKDHQYWYGLMHATKKELEIHPNAYCAFGLGSEDKIVLIPYHELAENINDLYVSTDDDDNIRHWHIRFLENEGDINLLFLPHKGEMNVTENLI
ncbi:DUF262 domain-containing protein [Gimesia sp.]|uniref:DUF262 domain-containing protein n=1 Tax=Gimesia sp. TaxID=2024833 RepID=UPI003A9456F8